MYTPDDHDCIWTDAEPVVERQTILGIDPASDDPAAVMLTIGFQPKFICFFNEDFVAAHDNLNEHFNWLNDQILRAMAILSKCELKQRAEVLRFKNGGTIRFKRYPIDGECDTMWRGNDACEWIDPEATD